MKRKLWLIIGMCLLLATCQTLLGRLRTSTPAALTVTETAQLSATGWIVALETTTPTATPTSLPTPLPLPSRTARIQETASDTPEIPTPTTRPKPTNPDAVPQIIFFDANLKEVDPGDTIVLSWEITNASEATLYLIPPSHHFPQSGWDVGPTGSYTITIDPKSRNYSEFMLYVDHNDQSISQGLTVYLRCPDPWFFAPEPNICPTAPLYSAAAEQHFEHGVMLWIEEQDHIIVLYSDNQYSPKYSVYQDEWDESQPDSDPSLQPPEGFDQPHRGFGLVWRSHTEVRDRLGWAMVEEMGFDTIIQQTTRYKYNATYIRALDGNVWYLGPERSAWEKIIIQQ